MNEIIVQILFEWSAKLTAAIGRGCRRGLQLLCVLALCTRATLRRLVVAAAMATMAGVASEGAGHRPQETAAPFEGLRVIDGVETSNDAFGIWLTWRSEHFSIRYPDGRPPFEQPAKGTEDLLVRLAFHCRAGRGGEGEARRETGLAEVQLPMHPDAPAVRNVLHPMYWVLGATGREYERTPVEVSLPGSPAFRTETGAQAHRLLVPTAGSAGGAACRRGAGAVHVRSTGADQDHRTWNGRAGAPRRTKRSGRGGTAGGGALRGGTIVTVPARPQAAASRTPTTRPGTTPAAAASSRPTTTTRCGRVRREAVQRLLSRASARPSHRPPARRTAAGLERPVTKTPAVAARWSTGLANALLSRKRRRQPA